MRALDFLSVLLFSLIVLSCGNNNNSTSLSNNYSVENVQIKKSFPNAWAVTGMIRNNSSYDIKGAVKIKFLNSNRDIVHNARAYVNEGDIIKPNQAGYFEYFTEPDQFKDVNDFDVEFYEN